MEAAPIWATEHLWCHADSVGTSLTFDEHVAALEAAGTRLVALAVDAGLDAPVPTCPAWTADALLAHQAMVHRWAAAQVRGDDPAGVPDETTIRTTVTDLPGYYREGHAGLLDALRGAPGGSGRHDLPARRPATA
jgi:hypothetical protein